MTQTRTPAPAGTSKPSPRLNPAGPVKLTGRGAIVMLFAVTFVGLLGAAWTGWGLLADAAFVCGCGVVPYYTKTSGLRTVVVSPPLLFLIACVCAEVLTASGTFMAAEGILVTLGTSAPWLFTGTALTVVVAVGRGYRPSTPRLPGRSAVQHVRDAVRDGRRPR
jgi:hypothetical protein